MKNIIELIQSGDITNNKILQLLLEYNNKNVDEFNESLERNDSLAAELESAKFTLNKQHEALLKQDSNEKILKANQLDYERANKQMIGLCKVADHKLAVEKKEHKAAKEQIKRNKAAATLKDKKIAALNKAG